MLMKSPPYTSFALFDESDREDIRALARADHADTIFGDIAFSDKKFDKFFTACLERPDRCGGLIARVGGEAAGFAHMSAGEYFIGEGTLITTVHVLYVHPKFRNSLAGGKVALRLAKTIQNWSHQRGIERILFHVTSGTRMETTHRFLKKMGAQTVGGNYVV